MNTKDLKSIQNTIGYKFDNLDLLQQAFIRRSFSAEHGGQNNEVLEFIGDKALDLAVIRLMMEKFGVITEERAYQEFRLRNPKYFQTKLDEGKFTDIKKDLVEKSALADSMNQLGFHNLLIMGNGDIQNDIQEQKSVKEDLFEAIVGAVAIDCNWNMDTITDVVKAMIDFDSYFENYDDTDGNYVGELQEWMQQNDLGLPNYKYEENDDSFVCFLNINGINGFTGKGSSKAQARHECAANAYNYLKENNYINNEYIEAVGDADSEQALRQLNELKQKGLISEPEWEEELSYDKNGNPIWTVRVTIPELDYCFVEENSSKKEAKRLCAFDLLRELMYEDD